MSMPKIYLRNFKENYMRWNTGQHIIDMLRNKKHVRLTQTEALQNETLPKLGKHTYLGPNVLICSELSTIGNYCSIAANVAIGPGRHPKNFLSTHPFQYEPSRKLNVEYKLKDFSPFKPCYIGNDVWIGMNAIVIDGLKIADGAIIGANTVVTRDVEPYEIYTSKSPKSGGGGTFALQV